MYKWSVVGMLVCLFNYAGSVIYRIVGVLLLFGVRTFVGHVSEPAEACP